MKKRTLVIGLVAVLLVGGVAAVKLGYLSLDGAVAQAPRPTGPRVVPVDVAIAQKKKVPVRVDLLGTVTPPDAARKRASSERIVDFRLSPPRFHEARDRRGVRCGVAVALSDRVDHRAEEYRQ